VSDSLLVVDANGTLVGPAVSWEQLSPVVAVRVGSAVILLKLLAGQIYGFDATYFDGPGCSGNPYLNRLATMALPNTAVDNLGRVFADLGGDWAQPQILSVADPSGCYPTDMSLLLAPATQVLDLPSRWVAPFRVQ
jgi:hypothetical protein